MKVLYVANHPVRVGLEEMLYHGFIGKFGKENVVDYPYIAHFHGKEPEPPWYSNCNFEEDDVRYSREDAYAMKDSYDLAVIGSMRKENRMDVIVPDLLSWGLACPIVAVDGEDCPYGPMVQKPLYDDPRIRLYFSRQYLEGFHGKLEKCRPISSAVYGEPGLTKEELQAERPIDVMMSMGLESFRASVLEVLKTLPCRTYFNTEGPPYARSPVATHRKMLLSSKIALSVTGDSYSYDQYQYYRIPYYGALLFASRRPTVIVDNFVDWESAVFFDVPSEIPGLVKRLLDSPETLKTIVENGRTLLLEKHTSVARVEYILKRLNS